jgi:hypothetical protein
MPVITGPKTVYSPFVDRKAGERLVEQQHFGFRASAIAISTRLRSP